MANKKGFYFKFHEELIERVDRVKGSLDRTEWLESAIEAKLGESQVMYQFACPRASECGYRTNSHAAVCSIHGMKVIPRDA